jgi:hypothetical protein
MKPDLPIKMAARSKAWTVFAHSKDGAVGSNPSGGMFLFAFILSVALRVGRGLATG